MLVSLAWHELAVVLFCFVKAQQTGSYISAAPLPQVAAAYSGLVSELSSALSEAGMKIIIDKGAQGISGTS